MSLVRLSLSALLIFLAALSTAAAQDESDVVFQIGVADARSSEFQYYPPDWQALHKSNGGVVCRYVVGKNKPFDWLTMHLSDLEFDALGLRFTAEIEFEYPDEPTDGPFYLVVGVAWTHKARPSKIAISTNGVPSEPLQVPSFTDDREDPYRFSAANDTGVFGHIAVPIPQGAIKKGTNVIAITLQEGSWLFYDYIALRQKPEPIKPQSLLNDYNDDLGGADKIVFAVRKPGLDPHWYANFGYYPTFDPEDRPFKPHDGRPKDSLLLSQRRNGTLQSLRDRDRRQKSASAHVWRRRRYRAVLSSERGYRLLLDALQPLRSMLADVRRDNLPLRSRRPKYPQTLVQYRAGQHARRTQ